MLKPRLRASRTAMRPWSINWTSRTSKGADRPDSITSEAGTSRTKPAFAGLEHGGGLRHGKRLEAAVPVRTPHLSADLIATGRGHFDAQIDAHARFALAGDIAGQARGRCGDTDRHLEVAPDHGIALATLEVGVNLVETLTGIRQALRCITP